MDFFHHYHREKGGMVFWQNLGVIKVDDMDTNLGLLSTSDLKNVDPKNLDFLVQEFASPCFECN
jgi:hypothetical protein